MDFSFSKKHFKCRKSRSSWGIRGHASICIKGTQTRMTETIVSYSRRGYYTSHLLLMCPPTPTLCFYHLLSSQTAHFLLSMEQLFLSVMLRGRAGSNNRHIDSPGWRSAVWLSSSPMFLGVQETFLHSYFAPRRVNLRIVHFFFTHVKILIFLY